ncbi:uncharacterized protein LOC116713401 [Xyrichtys novacula]|uniref:Uncharacterized protein LOC116713401 n=1 Tax=Xyrichtys novacula TaxID=13765 RepID=A0AAV1GM66_XYRNO|nr:uncharacterized protein LOC116713401 [Xyrichtys novacula]
MASKGIDEDEDMELDWTPVNRGRGRNKPGTPCGGEIRMTATQTSKRGLDGNSSDEGGRIVKRKVEREEFKIVLRFRKEDEQVNLSPIILSRELKKKVGDVEMTKILRDGNLLIICRNEEQKNKVMHVENICKKVIYERKSFRDQCSQRRSR